MTTSASNTTLGRRLLMSSRRLRMPFDAVAASIRFERVTLGAIVASGLSPGDAAMLMVVAGEGSWTAQRALERAAGTSITYVLPMHLLPESKDDAMPVRIFSGMIKLSHGLGWRKGTVYMVPITIPDSLVAALPGRRSDSLFIHPDIDPAAIMEEPRVTGALVSMPTETIDVRIPHGPAATLRVLRLMLAQRRLDRDLARQSSDGFSSQKDLRPVPREIWGICAFALLGGIIMPAMLATLAYDIATTGMIHTAPVAVWIAVTLVFACAVIVGAVTLWRTASSLSPRGIARLDRSLDGLDNILRDNHGEWLHERYVERGFTDRGRDP